jgi:hypothetical protein
MEAITWVFWFKAAAQNYPNQSPVPVPKPPLVFDLTHRQQPVKTQP